MHENISLNIELVCMITIVDREMSENIAELFKAECINFNYIALGKGTATSDVLDYLGLSKTEKSVIFTLLNKALSSKMQEILLNKFHIKKHGHGISFNIPISKSGGLRFSDKNEKRGDNVSNEFDYELVIAMSNHGSAEKVTDAAKTVNPKVGATIIHGRALGYKEVEKFLGITISPEKDIILILTKIQDSSAIMKAILRETGPHTESRAIVFSLPVSDAIGISALPE